MCVRARERERKSERVREIALQQDRRKRRNQTVFNDAITMTVQDLLALAPRRDEITFCSLLSFSSSSFSFTQNVCEVDIEILIGKCYGNVGKVISDVAIKSI